ncbi:MAG: division/cell wall cluster transcriptional repressor MraZ [Gammaproteobacteria bacterium]|nr:division/cell wall cluster transcriptional repressor MraZ [Gammaproteobacteria bacterium]
MFRGVSNLNIDVKGRIAMPARYRDRLMESCGGNLIVTVDPDRCLLIYPLPEWEKIEIRLMDLPSMNKQARGLQRLLLGHATDCVFDGQGRVLIPGPLRKVAGLDKHAVLIGQGNKFELWDDDEWTQRCNAWMDEEATSKELSVALESLTI